MILPNDVYAPVEMVAYCGFCHAEADHDGEDGFECVPCGVRWPKSWLPPKPLED